MIPWSSPNGRTWGGAGNRTDNGDAFNLRGIPLPTLVGAADGDVIASDGAGGFVSEPQADPGWDFQNILASGEDTGGEPITINGGLSILGGKKTDLVRNVYRTLFTVALSDGTSPASVFGGTLRYVAKMTHQEPNSYLKVGAIALTLEYSGTAQQDLTEHDTELDFSAGSGQIVAFRFLLTPADGNFEFQVNITSDYNGTYDHLGIAWSLMTDTPGVVTVA
jgi:hypothetical protein